MGDVFVGKAPIWRTHSKRGNLMICLMLHHPQIVVSSSLSSTSSSSSNTEPIVEASVPITMPTASFHWLWALERIKFKLAVTVYQALHSIAPQYLSVRLQYITDLPMRRRGRLRSLTSSLLHVRPSRLVTVGDRCFAAAGTIRLLTSNLPHSRHLPEAEKLKTHLFQQSYPDIVVYLHCHSGPWSYFYFGHYKELLM